MFSRRDLVCGYDTHGYCKRFNKHKILLEVLCPRNTFYWFTRDKKIRICEIDEDKLKVYKLDWDYMVQRLRRVLKK